MSEAEPPPLSCGPERQALMCFSASCRSSQALGSAPVSASAARDFEGGAEALPSEALLRCRGSSIQ